MFLRATRVLLHVKNIVLNLLCTLFSTFNDDHVYLNSAYPLLLSWCMSFSFSSVFLTPCVNIECCFFCILWLSKWQYRCVSTEEDSFGRDEQMREHFPQLRHCEIPPPLLKPHTRLNSKHFPDTLPTFDSAMHTLPDF